MLNSSEPGGMVKWVTFFSQTGSEIVTLSKKLDRVPDLIVTNNRPAKLRTISPALLDLGVPLVVLPNKPDLVDYIQTLRQTGLAPIDTLITLHGWLRVVPKEVIQEYPLIFNGHPGLITKYPELKGKDPQKKAWDLDLPTSGCVIHAVTEGVDEGAIYRSKEIPIRNLSMDEMFIRLHETSIDLWVAFLKRHWL